MEHSFIEDQTLTPAEFHQLAGQTLLAYSEQEPLKEVFSVEQKKYKYFASSSYMLF